MFDRLLVPLDGSLPAASALVVGGHLAEQFGARLDVLAIETTSAIEPSDDLFKRQIKRAGVKARFMRRHQENELAADIVAEATGTHPDANASEETLVVMQTWARGRSGGLVENTSELVLKQVGHPLIVLGPDSDRKIAPVDSTNRTAHGDDEGWDPSGPVIIATDGSDFGDTAVTFAAELAAGLGLAVEVVTVIDPALIPAGVNVGAEINALTGPARTASTITGSDVNYDVLHGNRPAAEIVTYAKDRNASFLALATHGLSGFARVTEDSVAMKVIRHAHCPVILNRPETKPEPAAPVERMHAVVGVDGSPGSELALDWATSKSDVLGSVKPVATYHVDALSDGVAVPQLYHQVEQLMADGATALLAESLEERHPDLLARSAVIEGYAGPALVRASATARLLVVGSRGRSALTETLLGSVTSYCVKQAEVPVAVIPEGTSTDRPLAEIVVGIDGSENSAAALRWALTHVAEGGRVRALIAWMPAPWVMEMIPPTPEMAEDARVTAEHLVQRVQCALDRELADIEVTVETKMGDPRKVLADAAADADLLVVGTRGHRGVAHLLLGSCTTSLLHHPTVATVVVPGGWPDPASEV